MYVLLPLPFLEGAASRMSGLGANQEKHESESGDFE